ncbi:LITAF domain-containing protein [Acipenser ruthenus]|uniref:LITAF domain-containing protein n=1 Tax=Acipenser ruthenus TaxID=7906 RepID=UPI00145BABE9|nr:LITAF domain-containing protein [Acipenser ruthenus]XP_058891609.1 LITAF domain-containing protein [Acipenser ruthenus]XP_058891610.1 LITAF domain-containing protein [Acipenser ruthenus]
MEKGSSNTFPSAPYQANQMNAYPSGQQMPYPVNPGVNAMTYPPPPPYSLAGEQLPTVPPVVVTQPLTDLPGMALCIHCQQQVRTTTEHQAGALTWVVCGFICLFVGCLGCCLIPFCVDSCKDVEHRCPTCKQLLHIHKRL